MGGEGVSGYGGEVGRVDSFLSRFHAEPPSVHASHAYNSALGSSSYRPSRNGYYSVTPLVIMTETMTTMVTMMMMQSGGYQPSYGRSGGRYGERSTWAMKSAYEVRQPTNSFLPAAVAALWIANIRHHHTPPSMLD